MILLPANLGQATAAVVALNKLMQLPAPGVNVGAGIHVTIQSTWNGSGGTPPGWTKTYTVPDGTDSSIFAPDDLTPRAANGVAKGLITVGDQTLLVGLPPKP